MTFTNGDERTAALVSVRNVGRGPVEVSSWGFRLDDGGTIVVPAPRLGNQPTPCTLDGGHSLTWHVLMEDLPQGQLLQLRAFVSLGTGATVAGNRVDFSAQELALT